MINSEDLEFFNAIINGWSIIPAATQEKLKNYYLKYRLQTYDPIKPLWKQNHYDNVKQSNDIILAEMVEVFKPLTKTQITNYLACIAGVYIKQTWEEKREKNAARYKERQKRISEIEKQLRSEIRKKLDLPKVFFTDLYRRNLVLLWQAVCN